MDNLNKLFYGFSLLWEDAVCHSVSWPTFVHSFFAAIYSNHATKSSEINSQNSSNMKNNNEFLMRLLISLFAQMLVVIIKRVLESHNIILSNIEEILLVYIIEILIKILVDKLIKG